MNPHGRRLSLFVPGRAVPQGSLTLMKSRSTGKDLAKYAPNVMEWRMKVTTYAREAIDLDPVFEGPIGIRITFELARPQYHFGTGKNADALVKSAPVYPNSAPDLDKLVRAVLDALTDARVWKDDGQVVWVQANKVFGPLPGARITLGEMP